MVFHIAELCNMIALQARHQFLHFLSVAHLRHLLHQVSDIHKLVLNLLGEAYTMQLIGLKLAIFTFGVEPSRVE